MPANLNKILGKPPRSKKKIKKGKKHSDLNHKKKKNPYVPDHNDDNLYDGFPLR